MQRLPKILLFYKVKKHFISILLTLHVSLSNIIWKTVEPRLAATAFIHPPCYYAALNWFSIESKAQARLTYCNQELRFTAWLNLSI